MAIGLPWPAGGTGVAYLCKCVRMAIGSSLYTTPMSTLGAGVGVKTLECLVLVTTLVGGGADCCIYRDRRKMDGLRRVLVVWCNVCGGAGGGCSCGLSHRWNAWRNAWISASRLSHSTAGAALIAVVSRLTPCMMWLAGVLVGMVRWWCRNSSASDTLVARVPLATMFWHL